MGRLAYVFPGQGAQSVGMGRELAEFSPAAAAVFQRAEEVRPGTTRLCFDGPADELKLTVNTQPCLFVVDLACARALDEALGTGTGAAGVAGFSVGEVAAAAYCGLLDETSAFEFVCARAAAMQECTERQVGTMFAVVGLGERVVAQLAADLGDTLRPDGPTTLVPSAPGDRTRPPETSSHDGGRTFSVHPVNYNCPGQTVVACRADLADPLAAAVTAAGGKAIRLAVSGAFHSPAMDPAVPLLSDWLARARFETPAVPLYANLTARPDGGAGATGTTGTTDQVAPPLTREDTTPSPTPTEPRHLLAQQVNHPVLWQTTIEHMIADGYDRFVEVGPGKALSGFIRKINPDVVVTNVCDRASLERTVEKLNG